ncbi:hypothetical protein ACIBF6_07260 [Streptosporangium amethystogenes]|uniref:hypothetical protein n=1 Tax=Streptosporangium amethystogenes TaxID=2002 RepID=UPI00379F1387
MPQTVVELARDVVAELAPGELKDFDFLSQAYLDNPKAARRAGQPSNEPNASGWSIAVPFLTTLAMAVITDVGKDLTMTAGQSAWSALKGRFAKKGTDTELPAVDDEERLRELAIQAAAEHGVTPENAVRLAEAIVKGWKHPR